MGDAQVKPGNRGNGESATPPAAVSLTLEPLQGKELRALLANAHRLGLCVLAEARRGVFPHHPDEVQLHFGTVTRKGWQKIRKVLAEDVKSLEPGGVFLG